MKALAWLALGILFDAIKRTDRKSCQQAAANAVTLPALRVPREDFIAVDVTHLSGVELDDLRAMLQLRVALDRADLVEKWLEGSE